MIFIIIIIIIMIIIIIIILIFLNLCGPTLCLRGHKRPAHLDLVDGVLVLLLSGLEQALGVIDHFLDGLVLLLRLHEGRERECVCVCVWVWAWL